ncbi:phage tail protein [Pseudomonas sp. SLFW]|uniref:phage tail protein n=1 Tax=Pseudomonas sp. SLFW TaxID=2683259 RepID=UPI0021150748|nr:phage tail protein [Pseudomonas sp. SLFW]
MIDQNSQFFAILTNVGAAKQANADALGVAWKITHMGVGDANNTDPQPSANQTHLINEWRRAPVNTLKIDPVNSAIIVAEQIIPADVGGRWIREIGLYDADGDLVAVANCAPSFKPLLAQGSGRTQIVRLNLLVSNSSRVELRIDPSVVLATRKYVEDFIINVLPGTRQAGTYHRVTVNSRGVVVSGSNPDSLDGYGISIASQSEAQAQHHQNNTKPMTPLRVFQAITRKLGSMLQSSPTDATPGKIMVVGAGGLMGTVETFRDANAVPYRTGHFGAHGEQILNGPRGGINGDLVLQQVFNENSAIQHWTAYSVDKKFTRRWTVNVWSSWIEDLTTANVASHAAVREGVDDRYPVTSKKLAMRLNDMVVPSSETIAGIAKIAGQKAVNAGTDDATIITPKKLASRLRDLLLPATEAIAGLAKVGSQHAVNQGAGDDVMVTPHKMRFGFALSLNGNGYIVFPVWMGSLVVQWTTSGPISPGGQGAAHWPIAFPRACLWATAAAVANNGNLQPGSINAGAVSTTRVELHNWGAITAAARCMAIGA